MTFRLPGIFASKAAAGGSSIVFDYEAEQDYATPVSASVGGLATTETINSVSRAKDTYGNYVELDLNTLMVQGSRIEKNIANGLTTETITVVNGTEFQVQINGGAGATAVFSGAGAGWPTLTADGSNRISFNSGAVQTASGTSLTITVTGTIIEMMVQEVTNRTNQNPSEYILPGTIQAYGTENDISVSAGGVITDGAAGAALTTITGLQVEGASTNRATESYDLSTAAWTKTGTCTATADSEVSSIGQPYSLVEGIASGSSNRIFDVFTGFSLDVTLATQVLLKRVSTTGELRVANSQGSGLGLWKINLSTIGADEVNLNEANPPTGMTITNPFKTSTGSSNAGILFENISATAIDIKVAFVQQEESAYPTSPIISDGAVTTRGAATLNWQTISGLSGKTNNVQGAIKIVSMPFSSAFAPAVNIEIGTIYGDANNKLRFYFTTSAGQVAVEKITTAGGTDTVLISDTWAVGDENVVAGRIASNGNVQGWLNAVEGTENTDASSLNLAADDVIFCAASPVAVADGESLKIAHHRVWTGKDDTSLALVASTGTFT